MNSFIIFCCIIATTYGNALPVSTKRPCPAVQPVQNVNVSELSGVYYGCKESANKFPELKQCTTLTLVPNDLGGWDSTYAAVSNKTRFRESLTATATINEQKNITLHYNSLYSAIPKVYLNILDYNQEFVIYWECNDNIETPGLWLFAKTPELCSTYEEKLQAVIQKFSLDYVPLTSVKHDNCNN